MFILASTTGELLASTIRKRCLRTWDRARHLSWSQPRTTLRYQGNQYEDIFKHVILPSFSYINERELNRKLFVHTKVHEFFLHSITSSS